jgi:hypothetical protein
LESLLAACDELMIKPVLSSFEGDYLRVICQKIGLDLILQPSRATEFAALELSVST